MLSYCYLYDWLTQDTPRMTLYEGCTWQARSLYTVNVKTSDYKVRARRYTLTAHASQAERVPFALSADLGFSTRLGYAKHEPHHILGLSTFISLNSGFQ
jgi:hypothetical protein